MPPDRDRLHGGRLTNKSPRPPRKRQDLCDWVHQRILGWREPGSLGSRTDGGPRRELGFGRANFQALGGVVVGVWGRVVGADIGAGPRWVLSGSLREVERTVEATV